MKKPFIYILFFLSLPAFAEDWIPPLKPNSILAYYDGRDDGTRLLDGMEICRMAEGSSLKILRNEIVAKYGRPFKDRELRDHFQATACYAVNPLYHEGLLTEADKANIVAIQRVEKGLGPDHPLLKDLRAGVKINVEDDALDISWNATSKTFHFQINGEFGQTTDELITIRDDGTITAKDRYVFRTEDDWFVIVKGEWYGTHIGGAYEYQSLAVRYDRRTRTVSVDHSGK
jgi:hypothetical protein